jgi:hypothetical protein
LTVASCALPTGDFGDWQTLPVAAMAGELCGTAAFVHPVTHRLTSLVGCCRPAQQITVPDVLDSHRVRDREGLQSTKVT